MIEFEKYLIDIKYPTPIQKKNELWDIEGVLKNRTNQKLKFDLRPLKNNTKQGSFQTKADKIVYDLENKYTIVDVQELHNYLNENNTKVVQLNTLLNKLDWNIVINK